MTATQSDRKLLALGISSAKFTAAELFKLADSFLKMAEKGLLKPKMLSYDEFQHPGGVSLLNVSMDKKELEDFTDTAKQGGVNATLKRNRGGGTYYLCLEGQRQNIEKTLADYRKMMQEKSKQEPLLERLEKARQQATAMQHAREQGRTQEKTQERGGNG